MRNQQPTPPADLIERFRPEEGATFKLLREENAVQLWVSTIKLGLHAEPRPPRTRYHVAFGGSAMYLFMASPEHASRNFEFAVSRQGGAHV